MSKVAYSNEEATRSIKVVNPSLLKNKKRVKLIGSTTMKKKEITLQQ